MGERERGWGGDEEWEKMVERERWERVRERTIIERGNGGGGGRR